MTPPLVSVVIPNFDFGHYVGEAIASALAPDCASSTPTSRSATPASSGGTCCSTRGGPAPPPSASDGPGPGHRSAERRAVAPHGPGDRRYPAAAASAAATCGSQNWRWRPLYQPCAAMGSLRPASLKRRSGLMSKEKASASETSGVR